MSDFSNSLTNKQQDVRTSNILAARGILDLIRTSLGPRGLDKMLYTPKNDVLITNDGATIMKQLEARHPTARMLVELSYSYDVEAGDGTTSVVVLCCSLLVKALDLMKIGVHPAMISAGYSDALQYCYSVLADVADDVNVDDDVVLAKIAKTTLYSKVISNCSDKLAPLCVYAVKQIHYQGYKNVDLSDIKIVKKLGGTVEDTALVYGICTGKKPGNYIDYLKNPKVMAISFSLAPPKTDMDSYIVVSDDAAINRLLEQERKITLKLCKVIAKTGCTCLLVQKSILRTAISDMAMYYLEKLKIAVVPDIDRTDFEFYCKSLEIEPATSIDEVNVQKIKECEEFCVRDGVTYINCAERLKTCTVLVRGANKLIIEEAERSIHDALCSVRSIIKMPFLVPGGACVEGYLSHRLMQKSSEVAGTTYLCYRAFADALDIIPLTLAENGGLNPIRALTELKQAHSDGKNRSGLDILNGGAIRDMRELDVLQPMLTSHSAIGLAVETCRMILKIDDIVIGR